MRQSGDSHRRQTKILVVIVVAQFLCTSVWFAGNAVLAELTLTSGLNRAFIGNLISAVQTGFILGTLLFAVLTISDRFPPSRVFFVSAVIAAAFNLALNLPDADPLWLLLSRFGTGFFLAGIYPVGMKIAADHFDQQLGKSLGFLVGALVIGTALPHLLTSVAGDLPWRYVITSTSLFSVAGGLAIWLLVPPGPYRKPAPKPDMTAFITVFSNPKFRSPAFAYFGHMWELYAFWTFLPLMITTYAVNHGLDWNVSLLAFFIIAGGGLACMVSGYAAQRSGLKNVAATALLISGICCLLSPVIFVFGSPPVFIGFLACWGIAVVADSPLFSTLVAQHAPEATKGTSLTVVNCIGFSITIVSIQLLNAVVTRANTTFLFTLLAIGPALGLVALLAGKKRT